MGTSKTLSLGEFDKSKTHLILSPFFLHFLEFKVQFNEELWNLHPQICVLQGLRQKNQKLARKVAKMAKAEKCRML